MPYFRVMFHRSDGLTDVTGPGQVEGRRALRKCPQYHSPLNNGGDTSIEPSPGPSSTFTLLLSGAVVTDMTDIN